MNILEIFGEGSSLLLWNNIGKDKIIYNFYY